MARRRGNNEGSIYKRPDGSWAGQVSTGYDPVTGKRKRKSFYGQTRREVADKVSQALRDMRNGLAVEPVRCTFGEWLDKWLERYKKPQLRQSTYESYESIIRAYIKPSLGGVPLAKVQANMLQNFYNEKLESGLSTRTVRYIHAVIRQALQQAVKEGLLSRNVADATTPPTVKSKQMQALSEDDLLAFFEASKEDRFFPAYFLTATTGMRRAELLGLCWDSVDLEQGMVTVRRQLLSLKGGATLEENTKSKRGRRSITLTDDAIKVLAAHRQKQAQEKLRLGAAYQDNGLVFCRKDGAPVDPRTFAKRFQRILEKAGLPVIRFHDLRHTHASLLLSRGIHPKIVQERLGHSSITMTLDLYSHLTPGLQEAAASSLSGLLLKKNKGKDLKEA